MRIQKMENLETLASGVAHEFNNIFTGIKGLTDLIRDEVDASSEVFEFATAIHQNIARGSELIQQLSSFARESAAQPARQSASTATLEDRLAADEDPSPAPCRHLDVAAHRRTATY